MWPSFLSLLSRKGTEENQGQIQGVASSFGSMASIAGLIIGGVLYPYLAANTFAISVLSILIVTIYYLYKAIKDKECSGINKPEHCALMPNPLFNHRLDT
jgi:MFS transporter, DHA1 family, tetracycline resistance protein